MHLYFKNIEEWPSILKVYVDEGIQQGAMCQVSEWVSYHSEKEWVCQESMRDKQ